MVRQLIHENSTNNAAKDQPEWKLRPTTLQGLNDFIYIYDEIEASIKKQSIESTLSQIIQLTKYEKTVINKDAKTTEQQHAKRENINELLSIASQYDEANADNPVTELPTESAVNAKLKELQDAWDAANGG